MGCLEHDVSLFNLPTEAKHWTLAAKKPGESDGSRKQQNSI